MGALLKVGSGPTFPRRRRVAGSSRAPEGRPARRNMGAASPSADVDRRHRSSCASRSESRKRASIDAENSEWAGVSPSRRRPIFRKHFSWMDAAGRRRLRLQSRRGGGGGNVWVKTTERVIVNTEDRTPLPRSGLQRTRPLGGKRNRPHLRGNNPERRRPAD